MKAIVDETLTLNIDFYGHEEKLKSRGQPLKTLICAGILRKQFPSIEDAQRIRLQLFSPDHSEGKPIRFIYRSLSSLLRINKSCPLCLLFTVA